MWLTDYRAQYGLTLEQLGGMIRQAGRRRDPELRVSDVLLYRLETDPKFRTVPKLADLIAEACGATAQQRDAMVLERYRGTWKPPRRRKAVKPVPYEKPSAAAPPKGPRCSAKGLTHGPNNPFPGARAVVKIDRKGAVVARYASCNRAALQNSLREDQISSRCHRKGRTDEFRLMGFTFRFAEEWDNMTAEAQRADISRFAGVKLGRGGTHGSHMVTVVDRHQHAQTYESMRLAAEGTGVRYCILQARLFKAQERALPVTVLNGLRFMFTTTWDNLTASEWEQMWRLEDELG